ncbi:hypothetical protein [Streptomyces sp. NPDC057340]|uniref:hypothetical protein n=1 Tax=Streptomyces sp. NPDC057340 TaxID=3346103 RepID=UPI003632B323
MGRPDETADASERLAWRAEWVASAVAVLAVGGFVGVLGPPLWARVGVVLLCLLAGPLWGLLCQALARRGGRPSADGGGRRLGLAVLAAALAAPLAVLGWVAFSLHHSSGYAMAYGEEDRLDLPQKCATGGTTATCSDWRRLERGDPDQVIDDEYRRIDVHFGEAAWAEYGKYYSLAGIGSSAGNIEIDVRIVGDDAYVTTGLTPTHFAPLGRMPLPWLAWASAPALLIPLTLGLRAPGPSAPGQPSPAPGTVSATSASARVTAASDRFVVEQAVTGPGGAPRWRVRLELEWERIAAMEFARERPGGPVTLCLRLQDLPTRRVLDATALSAQQWKDIAAAVAAHTHRRLLLDLSEWFPGETTPL